MNIVVVCRGQAVPCIVRKIGPTHRHMSTQRATTNEAVEADDEYDPYGVVPDSFVEEMNEHAGETISTIPAALDVAERLPSTTDNRDRRRCPSCRGYAIQHKTAMSRRENQKPGSWKCPCGHHFNTPLPSLNECDAAADELARLVEFLETGSPE